MIRLAILFILLSTCIVMGQDREQMARGLRSIAVAEAQKSTEAKIRVAAYLRTHPEPETFIDRDGNVVQLVDVIDGLPVYKTTFNDGAATTTGAKVLLPGGSSNLNLTGAGVTVGVWDSGPVYQHSEFDTRAEIKDFSTVSSHGTHVAGTLAAKGLNPLARGMAPEALIKSYDWNNDLGEMASVTTPDQTGLMFSNHSYGLIHGWYQNSSNVSTWTGNTGISSVEDYRFGYYSALTRAIDTIAANAPYYSIFWAVGNDRGDANINNGGLTFPADCNSGSGYDCIVTEAVAKNIFTIGSIGKVLLPGDPIISSNFSNWGPTDDGRIKPDLVGAGEQLFSTIAPVEGQSGNPYGTSSGTSMATPSVAGSLMLLQELYKKRSGQFMRAATLKALAIHSAKEAGIGKGPDYQFGWGVVDVEAGAKVIEGLAAGSALIEEEELMNGNSRRWKIRPERNTKIMATIAWTDRIGNLVDPGLDNPTRSLVNDLDIRIVDDAGNIVMPWTLDPANPSAAATAGDNIRDNVERVELELPEARNYYVEVTHKGSLRGGSQHFSVVVTYTPGAPLTGTEYYWVGGAGNWSDGSHWALTPGGVPANLVPTANDYAIVDGNSQLENATLQLTAPTTIKSLSWFIGNSILNLNGHTLEISEGVIITSEQVSIAQGILKFTGTVPNSLVSVGSADLSSVELVFHSVASELPTWEVSGTTQLGKLILKRGNVDLSGEFITLNELDLSTGTEGSLDISFSVINSITNWKASTLIGIQGDAAILTTAGIAAFDFATTAFAGEISIPLGSNLVLMNSTEIRRITVEGTLELPMDVFVQELQVYPMGRILLSEGTTLSLTETTELTGLEGQPIYIESEGTGATMAFSGYYKKCFDYLELNGVALEGTAVVTTGDHSVLVSSPGWLSGPCEEVLFPEFNSNWSCVGSLVVFTNTSGGNAEQVEWDFGPGTTLTSPSNATKGFAVWATTGLKVVKLTISNATESRSLTREIEVGANPINLVNSIQFQATKLVSKETGDSYLWLQNSELLPTTDRQLEYIEGDYRVAVVRGGCNQLSESFVITAIEAPDGRGRVTPNPFERGVEVEITEPSGYRIVDLLGRELQVGKLATTGWIDLEVPEGMYFLEVTGQSGRQFVARIVKKD